jgi:hypothetical protein
MRDDDQCHARPRRHDEIAGGIDLRVRAGPRRKRSADGVAHLPFVVRHAREIGESLEQSSGRGEPVGRRGGGRRARCGGG